MLCIPGGNEERKQYFHGGLPLLRRQLSAGERRNRDLRATKRRQRLWPREAVDQSLLDPTTHPDQADMGD